jgi:hypothetical protein
VSTVMNLRVSWRKQSICLKIWLSAFKRISCTIVST